MAAAFVHTVGVKILQGRCWRLGAGIMLLFYVVLPAVYSPARAQKSGDAKKAQALYEKALQKNSVAERIHLLEQAAQFFAETQSSTVSPEIARQIANIHAALGREFYQQANWQAAITHLEKALAFDFSLLPAHATLGMAYFQQGQYGAAIQAYELVLRAQPNAQLYNNLGAAYEAKNDLAAAVEAYSRALELDANLSLAQKNLQRAQAKLSRLAALKAAFNDSVRLAAKARDSLAAATAKRKDAPRLPAPDQAAKKSSTARASSPRPSQPSASTTQRTTKPAASKQEPLLAAESNKPPSLKNSARDSAATPIKNAPLPKVLPASETPISPPSKAAAALKPPSSVTEKSKSVDVSIPRAAKPSTSWAGPITFGISALLLAMLAIILRRRLGHIWLQVKPALTASAAVASRQVRLLPARMRNELVARYERARRIKLLPIPTNGALAGAPLQAESPETIPVVKNPLEEPRQPSLQTQAFFAEMIAAEPEIEEFDDGGLAKIDEPCRVNGHIDRTSAGLPLSPIVVNISKDADPVHLSIKPTDPIVGDQLSVASDQLPVISEQLPANSNQLPVTSDQLSSTGNRQSATNNHRPVNSNQQQATSPDSSVVILQGRSGQPATGKQHPASSIQSNPAASGEDPASTGHAVLGRYVIEREIGKGAMGSIYLALDPKLDRRVVIKTVCFNLAASETETLTLKDRVYREARAIAKLAHPNIVVVYDVEDDKNMSYIVMEHIEGQDLRQALTNQHHFDVGRAVKIVSQVCNALNYAHQAGIVHRDIKPSNIMLLPGDKAKVTDFGIAKIADNFSLTLPGHVLGTPSYMAPEQFEGLEIDGRADIFSLGVVFYELVTGCRPFAGNSLASLAYKIVHKMHIPPSLQNLELPLELDEIIGRALAKNPAERYATAMEFHEALQTLQAEAAQAEAVLG